MKVKRIDIQNFILGIICIISYIWPYYFSVLFSGYNSIVRMVFMFAGYAITLLIAFFARKRLFELLKNSRIFIFLCLLLLAVLVLSTVIHRGELKELLNIYRLAFLVLLLACAIVSENIYLLKGITFTYNVLIIITFINALVPFPKLSGVYNFATTKNVYLRYIFLGIVIDAYLDFQEKGDISLKTYIYLGLVSFSSLLFKSSTGFFAPFVVLILLIIRKLLLNNNMKLAKSRLFLYTSVGIGVLVVFLRQFKFYEGFLGLLGKNLTFTGRTIIWDQALERIGENPILGSGHISYYGDQTFGNFMWSSPSSHNLYLDVMVETGIVGLVIFFCGLLLLTRYIDHSRDRDMAQCFSILFFCLLLSYDFEVFFNSGQYMYNFPILFFLSFIFAGNTDIKHRIHFVWGKSKRSGGLL